MQAETAVLRPGADHWRRSPAATGSCGTHAALSPSAFNGEPLAGTSTLDSGLRNYQTMHFSSFK